MIAVLAGVATFLPSGLAFVTSPGASHGTAGRAGGELRGSSPPMGGSRPAAGSLAVALPLLALSGLAAAATQRRSGKVATAAVITKDAEGRYRFQGEVKALAPEDQVGATKPLGFWDPLGLTKGTTVTYPDDPTGFKFLRSAELKNGRVAMMASIGLVAPHFWKFPGFDGVPTGAGALMTDAGGQGFAALVIAIGFLEAGEYVDGSYRSSMGNYGDPLNLGNYNTEYQNKELNNCRMAMFAVLGQLSAEFVTGKDAVQQLGLV